ncbi:hypothetical protein PO909_001459 [Leuciscus waleckii]
MDPDKVKAAVDWPIPDSRKALQRFLGFSNFCRRFIRNFSQLATPLTALTSTRTAFRWSNAVEAAFTNLKSRFVSAPILVAPEPSRQFVVEVDASEVGVCAVLSQRSSADDKMHPCALFSHRLSTAERNYNIGNRELLAVKLALEEWHHWLEGAGGPFIVWTDHKNLEYIRSAKRLNSRQARWALFLGRFDFLLSYLPGSKNIKPDALSRIFDRSERPFTPECILPEKLDGLLQPLSVPSRPWSHFIPLPKFPSAKETAVTVVNHVFRIHGLPTDVVSDRGPQFISKFWGEFCRLLGASVSLSSGFHPQTNSQAERANQDLERVLRCLVSQNPSSWSQQISWVEYALNSLPVSSTGLSPFECSLGYQPPIFPSLESEVAVPSAHAFVQKCRHTWRRTLETLLQMGARTKVQADHHRLKPPVYVIGQKVIYSDPEQVALGPDPSITPVHGPPKPLRPISLQFREI